jgi:hypothetical protein
MDRTIISILLFVLISIPLNYLGGETARYADDKDEQPKL